MAGKPVRPVNAIDQTRRMLSLVTYLRERPGARVEDVVARAGVGHGTFYAYFRNKRAALAALVSENAATLVELAAQPWRPGDVRASLVEVLGGLSDLYDRDADLIALWTEASIQDPELGRILDEVRRQFVARIARNIEHAAAGATGTAGA